MAKASSGSTAKRVSTMRRSAARGPAAGGVQRGASRAERPLLLGRLLGRSRAASGGPIFAAARPRTRSGRRDGEGRRLARARSIAASTAFRRGARWAAFPRRPIAGSTPAPSGRWWPTTRCSSTPPGAPPIMATVDALLRRCFLHGGFFQDMIHSGDQRLPDARHRADAAPRGRRVATATWSRRSPSSPRRPASGPRRFIPQTRRRLHGRRPAWLGRRGVGDDDAQSASCARRADRLIVGSGLFAEWFESDESCRSGRRSRRGAGHRARDQSGDSSRRLRARRALAWLPPRVDVAVPGLRDRSSRCRRRRSNPARAAMQPGNRRRRLGISRISPEGSPR